MYSKQKQKQEQEAALKLACVVAAFIGNLAQGDAAAKHAIEDGKNLAHEIMSDPEFFILFK